MAVPARITLVTLGVADVEASTRFYEALGWARHGASVADSTTFIQLNGLALSLYKIDMLAADARQPVPGTGFRGSTLAINLESEAEVDDVFGQFVAAGGTALAEPERAFWGGYTSLVADLDGHAWEIAFNPGWPLGDGGTLTLPD